MPHKSFVIFDTEYTTWKGAMDRGWSGENERRELVQISAIKVDQNSLKEIDHLDLLVQPKHNPVLSDFFTSLTGITNQDLQEKGISFDAAMQNFADFSQWKNTFSYGNDGAILGENIGYGTTQKMVLTKIYFNNWAYFFHSADEKTRVINSGKLAKHFGVDGNINGQEHNALYDCRSQLEAFKFLYQKGHKFLF